MKSESIRNYERMMDIRSSLKRGSNGAFLKHGAETWKDDKIKCLFILKKFDSSGNRIECKKIAVFLAKDGNDKPGSGLIERTKKVEERFKYRPEAERKVSIPKRVFNQLIKDKRVETYFTQPVKLQKEYPVLYDKPTNIKREVWMDFTGKLFFMHFRVGKLVSSEVK